MDEETIKKLDTLRHNMVADAGVHRIMELLLKYYPAGTQVVITKDYWKIEENK